MASVLVKGMEMPARCFDCGFCDYECAYCLADVEERNALEFLQTRPDWCPLVEVPPCGRLGDLDVLERMFSDIDNAPYSGFDGAEPFYSADDAAQIIRLAPTIIPADREEDGADA